jgi:hypothetical protein
MIAIFMRSPVLLPHGRYSDHRANVSRPLVWLGPENASLEDESGAEQGARRAAFIAGMLATPAMAVTERPNQ